MPPEDVYIGGQVGQRIHVAPDPYQPGDFFDIFGQQAEEEEGRHTPELSVQGHREILRNIEDAGEVSSFWLTPGRATGVSQGQLPGEREGAPVEGREETWGAHVLEGPRSAGNEEGLQFEGDGLPQYAQMVSFVEEVVRPDSPEDTGGGGVWLGPAEEEALGYLRLTQETQPRELVYEEEGQTSAQWIDNLLDWTVRDHADISIDYNLGEIANRSFQDRYGIWAGQEEIFPDRGAIRPATEELAVAELSKENAAKAPIGQIRREVADSGGLAPWAASTYLRAMAEERERVDRLSVGEGLVQGTDPGELEVDSIPWEGIPGRGEGSREVEELGEWKESSGGGADEFLSSTQISGHGGAPWTGGGGGRTLSPIGGRRGGGLRGGPGPGIRLERECPGTPGASGEADDFERMGGEVRLGNGSIAMHSPERTSRVIARGAGTTGELLPGGEAKERHGADFLSSTLLSGQVGGVRFEEEGGPSLSPLGISGRVDNQGRPSFITGLYQDEDRRLMEIARQGGLTFYHSVEGDVEIQERSSGSSIPQRYPPMGESTVDWSLLGRLQYSPEPGRGRKGRRAAKGGQGRLEEPSQGEGDSRPRTSKGTAGGGEKGSMRMQGALYRKVMRGGQWPTVRGCLAA